MPTRAQLRTSTRVAADQDNSTFPTDTALNDILDRAAGAVWRQMITKGWKPDRTTVPIAASGATSYVIGTNVSIVNSVMYLGSPGSTVLRVPLIRAKPEDLPSLLTQLGGTPAIAYDLIGGGTGALTVELYPVPTTGAYEVRYTKRFPGFASDSDTWIGPDGSDELIITTAAIESVNKEGDPAGMVKALTDRLNMRWAEVIDAAGWVDSQGQQTVRDVRATRLNPIGYNAQEAFVYD